MDVTLIGFLCTGVLRPGTVAEGLAVAWPPLVLATGIIVFIMMLPRITSRKLLRIGLYAISTLLLVVALMAGVFMYDLGKNCRSAEPSAYQRMHREEGIV